MSLFCGLIGNQGKMKHSLVYGETILHEFSKQNPDNQQIDKICQTSKQLIDISKYKGWKHQKVLSKNSYKIFNQLHNKQTHFIDKDFPHEHSSIGTTFIQNKIIWQRIINIVSHPVFAHHHQIQYYENFTCSSNSLQSTIRLLARVHPKKLKQMLCGQLNNEGIYQFRFFRNGIIQEIIIDDYIPTLLNKPLFTGFDNIIEAFPILLEKALAKAFGSYENIPKSSYQLLSCITCAPFLRIKLSSQQIDEGTFQQIETAFDRNCLMFAHTKSNNKMIESNLSEEGELFSFIEKHKQRNHNKNIYLYELTRSDGLLTSNGAYSMDEMSFEKLQNVTKSKLNSSTFKNNSFLVQQTDLSRLFRQIIVFQNIQTQNKDWIQSQSKTDYPSLNIFKIAQQTHVTITITVQQNIKQIVLLVKQIKQYEYEFIAGKLIIDQKTGTLQQQLGAGTYLICVLHDWGINSKYGTYSIFVESNSLTALDKAPNYAYRDFLENLFRNFAENNTHLQQNKNHAQSTLYSLFLLRDLGLSFLVVKVNNARTKQYIRLYVDNQKLKNENWEILQPYANQEEITFNKGSINHIVILKATNMKKHAKLYFPSTAFRIKS